MMVSTKTKKKALKLHKLSSDCNDQFENFRIGKEYHNGHGDFSKNIAIGVIYLNRAAFDQNYSNALQYLGNLLFYGDDSIDKDQVKALELHKMSANRINGSENFSLGKGYCEGYGDYKKNTTIGLIYLKTAAFNQNDSKALQYLGDLFYYGDDDINED